MNTPTKKVQIFRHTAKQHYELFKFITEHYTQSGKNNPEFAEQATKTLGFSVSYSQVKDALEQLGIPANHPRVDTHGAPAKIAAIERRIAELNHNYSALVALHNKLREEFDKLVKELGAGSGV